MVWILSAVATLVLNSLRLLRDILTFFRLCLPSPAAVAAENLFLRKQLTLYIERKTKPRRATDSIRRYMPRQPRRLPEPSRWMTFVRNHAKAVISSDFFVVVTATFQLVYVFVIMEIETRRILHFNVTRHPNADWTLQQFRECIC